MSYKMEEYFIDKPPLESVITFCSWLNHPQTELNSDQSDFYQFFWETKRWHVICSLFELSASVSPVSSCQHKHVNPYSAGCSKSFSIVLETRRHVYIRLLLQFNYKYNTLNVLYHHHFIYKVLSFYNFFPSSNKILYTEGLIFYYYFFFHFFQTENPNSERPYSFKDFLLHPRRFAFHFLLFASLFTFHFSFMLCLLIVSFSILVNISFLH